MKICGKFIVFKFVFVIGLILELFMFFFFGKENFKGIVFYVKDFKKCVEEFNDVKLVVVIGGNKLVWDVCYIFVICFNVKVYMVM